MLDLSFQGAESVAASRFRRKIRFSEILNRKELSNGADTIQFCSTLEYYTRVFWHAVLEYNYIISGCGQQKNVFNKSADSQGGSGSVFRTQIVLDFSIF